jgi:benzoate/toluate 1,2-dioxygenase beta subunit
MSGNEAAFAQLLWREALALDRGEFDEWLGLFTPDCLFWMPAWRDDGTQTEDPDRELSLIYYRGRRNLEDRIRRVRSGLSVASAVMPRTAHLIGNILVDRQDADSASLTSVFNTQVHDVRTGRSHAYFGRYEHGLVRSGTGWLIDRKVIRLLNDTIPTMLDVYSI